MAMMVKPGAALANQRDRTKPVESKFGQFMAKRQADRAAQLAPGIAAQKAAQQARAAKHQEVVSAAKASTEKLKASTAKLQDSLAKAKARRAAIEAAKAKPPGMAGGGGVKSGSRMSNAVMTSRRGRIAVNKDMARMGLRPRFNEGGKAESKAMVKKEVAFMKEKGAPKSMIRHEAREAKGYTRGGGIESRGKTRGEMVKMREGGSVGGSYRSAADGVASKGKTKGHMVKMAYGGKC